MKIQRVGPWVAVITGEPGAPIHGGGNVWFLAAQVQSIEQFGNQPHVMFLNGTSISIHADAEKLWEAIAGPARDDAVTLGARLAKPQEQT